MDFRVLIVDDEKELTDSLSEILADEGYATLCACDPLAAIPLIERERVDLVILDIRMPGMGGIDLLKLMRKHSPALKVMILTGHPSVENAVLSMKYGAVDFFEKPPNLKKLLGAIGEFAAQSGLASEPPLPMAGQIVTRDPQMRKMLLAARTAAATQAPILITGESGTGKELIAGAVHAASPRAQRPFIKVNCAAIPEALLESELFGHEKGAFTDALSQRKGKFELAHEGTIFLDEIGDMSPGTQAKILRALQEGEFERVGGSATIKADIRVIAATNKDLRAMIKDDRFRQDLFYRLCVIPLHVPPLRERVGDIEALIEHFIRYFGAQYGKSIEGLEPKTEALLLAHDWPGNVRELRNCVERAVIFCESELIRMEDLPSQYMELDGSRLGAALRSSYEELSRSMILEALQRSKGKKATAAGMLNIDRRTLYNRMKRLGLD